MPKFFQFFVVVFALFWCTTILAQVKTVGNTEYEASPNMVPVNHDPNLEAMWDVLLSYDIVALSGAAGNAGAEWDGTSFYSTRWASNLIHEYSADGTTLIREFSIPGVTGLRDLAYDGTYFYGGASSSTIYQMDFATETLVGQWNVTGGITVRNISYDEANDGFWTGNWADPVTLFDRSGNQLAQIVTGLPGQYGSCYDNVSPGGPFLWVFDQGAGEGTPQLIHQFDIATGTATGVTHDVMTDVGSTQSGIAGGLFSMTDFVSGFFTIGGLLQGGSVVPGPDMIFVYEVATAGPPCPVDPPTNPDPVNGAIDVSINLAAISWTNGAGANNVEVWFDGAMVYDGTAISTWSIPGPLTYSTTYGWKIVGKNDTCGVSGPTWSFTTVQDPLLVTDSTMVYPQSVAYWTGTTDGVTKTDDSEVRCVDIEDGWMMFDISSITDIATILQITYYGYVNLTDWPYWSATPLPGLNPLTASASDLKAAIEANSGLGVAYLYEDESSSFVTGWHDYVMESWTNTDFQAALAQDWFAMGMDSRDNSASYYVNWDGWNQTNVPYLKVIYEYIIPVELTSFTASVNENDVTLNWTTATELNNQGFEIQRNSGNDFQTIGFVNGYGTTTEVHEYSFTDVVTPGSYSYRLKQVDYDGTFEYSDVVEVDITVPDVFALEQNYPNPFNPSTIINFSLAVDSKVSLKVFDVLGQEVVTLISSDLVAGAHNVDFNASSLNSGVYFYRIEAAGIDGTNFTNVKKMILTK